MNRILITLIVVSILNSCVQQEKVLLEKPTVDERVELLSIVFRLAEKDEYSSTTFNLYTKRINQYFENYKNHELIQLTKSIINENGVAFDGPMWMATHLDDSLKPIKNVKDIWEHDPRWTKENTDKFVLLLQKFYKDTKFNEFFKDNTDLYNESVKRFKPICDKVDLNWCYSFFGKERAEIFLIKIGLGISGNCYGTNVDYINGNRNVYAIMGVWAVDKEGLPEFSSTFDLPILMHEFCHPFIDNLAAKHKDLFIESGEKIYSIVKNVMNSETYPSWEVIFDEALVHASTIKYMKDHDFEQSEIERWIIWLKEDFGFFWIKELIDELENYDKQREKYPTLESYMPKLGDAYKIWTKGL